MLGLLMFMVVWLKSLNLKIVYLFRCRVIHAYVWIVEGVKLKSLLN